MTLLFRFGLIALVAAALVGLGLSFLVSNSPATSQKGAHRARAATTTVSKVVTVTRTVTTAIQDGFQWVGTFGNNRNNNVNVFKVVGRECIVYDNKGTAMVCWVPR